MMINILSILSLGCAWSCVKEKWFDYWAFCLSTDVAVDIFELEAPSILIMGGSFRVTLMVGIDFLPKKFQKVVDL